ncbi:mitochondrial membrane protein [Cyanidiococcus yangmingshanensis]|uniref:Mitochondrial membrane protein n=1 Tax=Cyanidiococcus yangmingshanensis TaxID=2690220 RepID=A0A7J7IQM7_9RHOD|nr:mitochondrial membrane protein [Cyanidiococcus yangmingshanensis]
MGNSPSGPELLEEDKKQLLEKFAEEEAAFADPRAAQETLERCGLILENSKAYYDRLRSGGQSSKTNGTASTSKTGSDDVDPVKDGRVWRARQQLQKAQFNYGWALVQQPLSTGQEQIREGIRLLQGLAEELEANSGSDKRDQGLLYECHYFAALAMYRLGDWSGARQELRTLYSRHIGTSMQRRQIRAFLSILDDKIRRDGWIGLGVATALFGVAGAAIVGGVLAAQKVYRREPYPPSEMTQETRSMSKSQRR